MCRKISKIVIVILGLMLTLWLNLTLHELGHAIFAVLTGNKLCEISYGVSSFADIQIVNKWSIPLISLGSFILPLLLILLVMVFCKERIYPNVLFMPLGCILGINLAMSGIAAFVPKTTIDYWDLLLFAKYSSLNQIAVGIVSLLIGIAIIIICSSRYFKAFSKLL